MKEMLIIAIISTFCLVISIATVKNKPKIPIEKYKSISLKQIKQLWKHKYNTYLIVMSSVFLGLSWSFLAQCIKVNNFSVELNSICKFSGVGSNNDSLGSKWKHFRDGYVRNNN